MNEIRTVTTPLIFLTNFAFLFKTLFKEAGNFYKETFVVMKASKSNRNT